MTLPIRTAVFEASNVGAARAARALRWAVLGTAALSWGCSTDSGPGGANAGAGGVTAGASGASGSSSGVGGMSGSSGAGGASGAGGSSGGVGGSAGSAGMGGGGAGATSGGAGSGGVGGGQGGSGGGQAGGGSGGMGGTGGMSGSSGSGGGGQGGDGGGGGALPETAYVFLGGAEGNTGVVALYSLTYATAELTLEKRLDVGQNGSFLAVDAARSALYVVDDSGRRVRRVTLDAATWEPSAGNDQASSGEPVHVAVSSDGAFVLTAQYNQGSVEVFGVSGGMLGASVGTQSPGSQAHQVVLSPEEDYLFVPCKGADRIERYAFNKTTGALTAPMSTATGSGAGPRHLAFAPGGTFAYLINELDNTVYVYSYAAGALTELQRITSLPDGFSGSSTGAEIAVSPSGTDVYASNRPQGQDGTIAQFRVGADGRLTANGHRATGGRTPRSFAIDPTGRVVIAGNLDSSSVGLMAVDGETGELGAAKVITLPFRPWYVGIFLPE
jgi:6-phosphogluconolactonase